MADETRATDARYSIVHESGTAEVSVNQRAAGDLWQYLGSYTFDPLSTPTVALAANDNGSVAADAVRFVGGPGGATDIAYLHSDHLGTPQVMTDANAQVLWWRDQTPFGQTVAEGGFSSSPLRFPGQYADTESSLAYNYFRDYDPALGRYIQSDPIGLRGGLNTYGYVGGNPVRWVDPSGLQSVPEGWPYPNCTPPLSDEKLRGMTADQLRDMYRRLRAAKMNKEAEKIKKWQKYQDLRNKGKPRGGGVLRGPVVPFWGEWQTNDLCIMTGSAGPEAQAPQEECDPCGDSG